MLPGVALGNVCEQKVIKVNKKVGQQKKLLEKQTANLEEISNYLFVLHARLFDNNNTH